MVVPWRKNLQDSLPQDSLPQDKTVCLKTSQCAFPDGIERGAVSSILPRRGVSAVSRKNRHPGSPEAHHSVRLQSREGASFLLKGRDLTSDPCPVKKA